MGNNHHNGTDGWAVITGASGGLGTSFVLACARRGYHLLLMDLPGRSLPTLCDFISRNFPVNVKYLEIDLSAEGFEKTVLQKIKEENIRVKMLINNAGISQNELFENSDGPYMRKMIELNGIACVLMTKTLLPELKSNARSYIINVSSFGSFYPLPRKTVYAAVKGFVRQFSQALRMEVGKDNVNVSILCPGPMTTNIGNYILHRNLNWIARKTKMHPDAVAEKAVTGVLRGKEIIIPGRLNRVLKVFSSMIPGFVRKKLTLYSMKQLEKNNAPVKKVAETENKKTELEAEPANT